MPRSPSVLVVDDEIDVCQNMADILLDQSYEVDTAVTAQEAIDLVRSRTYDVALLDLKMPDSDGLVLYRELRRLCPEMVAILVTAYASDRTIVEASHVGFWHVMPKPVDLSRLLPLVEQAVDQPVVLVVDDDRDLCENLWEIFRNREIRACLAHTGNEAEQRLQLRDFGVVLVDLKLPSDDGREVIARIHALKPEVRTVLITGYPSELTPEERCSGPEADAVLLKPFDIPQLLETIQSLTRSGKV
jgi:two-component system response regulator HydG